MNRNTAIKFVLGCVVWTVVFAGLLAQSGHAATVRAETCATDNDYCQAHPTCQEDEACWNWAKLGNEKRGVIEVDGTPKIVGPCGFNRLWAHGAIRYSFDGYKLLEKLRGDVFARTLTDCPWRIRENHPYPWHQGVGRWAVKHGY